MVAEEHQPVDLPVALVPAAHCRRHEQTGYNNNDKQAEKDRVTEKRTDDF